MKRQRKKVLIAILLSISFSSFGQKNAFSIRFGYGHYQGPHLGVHYFYTENLNLGVSLGSHFGLPPLKDEDHINVTLENNFHIGKKNRMNSKPWIFGQQFMYWMHRSETVTWKIVSISPSIGRIIAINNRLGIGLEVGPTLNYVADIDRDPTDPIITTLLPIYYNYRAQIIYMF